MPTQSIIEFAANGRPIELRCGDTVIYRGRLFQFVCCVTTEYKEQLFQIVPVDPADPARRSDIPYCVLAPGTHLIYDPPKAC